MFGDRRARLLLFGTVAAIALSGCGGGGGGGGGGGSEVVVVTFASQAGWTGGSDNCAGGAQTGDQGFLFGPDTPPRGAGSYGLVVGSDAESFEAIGHPALDGTRFADVSALSYSAYVANPGGEVGLAPYVTLLVDTTGDNVADDGLVYMPGLSGTVTVGAWQTWNTLPGVWCDSTGCGTRAEYLALHPDTRIVNDGATPGFFVAVGCGAGVLDWANFEAAVDAVTIGAGGGTTVYDFEP